MTDGVRDLLEVHACACNGRAVETLTSWWSPSARCECDGRIVGEGPEAIRSLLEGEWSEDLIGRVVETENGRMLVGYDGLEGEGDARVTIRFEVVEGRVESVIMDHLPPPA